MGLSGCFGFEHHVSHGRAERALLFLAEDSGALGKARGHALRLAAVLEFLWWCGEGGAEPQMISASATNAACRLMEEYCLPMAHRVHGDAAIPAAERNAMVLARRLRARQVRSFNAKRLRREIGGPLREATSMDQACAALVEAGLICARPERQGGNPGRAAKNYDVNPAMWAEAP